MGIPVVSHYKYLGTWISPSTKEVVNRAVQSVRKFGYTIAEKTRSLLPEITFRAMSGFVLGKLLY